MPITDPINDRARRYGETVLEQGKVALDEVRRPWLAAVGATDLAYGALRERLEDLPAETQARLDKLRSGTGQIDAAHVRAAVETATSQARQAFELYATQARETYESLAHRGDLVVRRLRRSPGVRGAFDEAEELLASAGSAAERAEEKVTHPTGTRGVPARKAAAKRPAAKA